MFFSEEELITILKKHLPDKNEKDLEPVAKSILDSGKHWYEFDLHQKVHDEVEKDALYRIIKRHAPDADPAEIRLFFKREKK